MLALPAEAARLQSWRFDTETNKLTFTTDDSVKPTAQLISGPTRLVIDLPGTSLSRPETQAMDNGAIKAISVNELDNDTTQMVVEYNDGYTVDPSQVQVRGEGARRWTVQLPEAITPEAITPEAKSTEMAIGSDRQPAAAGQLDTSELPTVPKGQYTVVIDPGHGGRDPGAVGIGELQEKVVVNDIAPKVAEILRKQGVNVVMTRDSDIEVDLAPRVETAERANASLFISIHANAISMSRPDVNGLETFYASDAGHQFANTVHETVLRAMGMRDRQVRSARFYVIRRTSMPAILIETGFVTGAEDSPNLAAPEWRDRMAEAIAQGILLHLQRGL